VLLIDWTPDSSMVRKEHMIPKGQALEIFKAKGFEVEREIDSGLHHYGMILMKTNK